MAKKKTVDPMVLLAESNRELAAAIVKAAKIRVGWIRPKVVAPPPAPVAPADMEFETWLQRQELPEAAREELAVFRDMYLGRRPATAEQMSRARRAVIEARVPMPRE